MKVFSFLFCFFLINQVAYSQTNIYFFPGQGADRRIFDSLQIDASFNKIVMEYGTPSCFDSMESFASTFISKIDTSKPFILVGVSLGGMICVELSEKINPQKTIIISSAKNRNELPFRYKFQKQIPFYKLIPGRVLLWGAKIMQPIVEPDRKNNKATFKSMLKSKTPLYMKRTVPLIIKWNRVSNKSKIYHIHGTKDHTIPFRNVVSPDFVLKNGSHMMTLTRAKEVSDLINSIIREE